MINTIKKMLLWVLMMHVGQCVPSYIVRYRDGRIVYEKIENLDQKEHQSCDGVLVQQLPEQLVRVTNTEENASNNIPSYRDRCVKRDPYSYQAVGKKKGKKVSGLVQEVSQSHGGLGGVLAQMMIDYYEQQQVICRDCCAKRDPYSYQAVGKKKVKKVNGLAQEVGQSHGGLGGMLAQQLLDDRNQQQQQGVSSIAEVHALILDSRVPEKDLVEDYKSFRSDVSSNDSFQSSNAKTGTPTQGFTREQRIAWSKLNQDLHIGNIKPSFMMKYNSDSSSDEAKEEKLEGYPGVRVYDIPAYLTKKY